jgi:8-oxo-dGTP pyrophosphatase MutT (NUDIX family)
LKKRHIGVYGVLQKNDRLLLILKTRGPYKGKLDLPGGGIEHGEGIEKALQRELKEEIGFYPSNDQISLSNAISITINYEENGNAISFNHIGLIYRVTDFKENEISYSIHNEDVNGAKWVELSIDKSKLSPLASFVVKNLGGQHV